MAIPAYIRPLVWLLVFDGAVVVIWWVAGSLFEITPNPKMEKIIIGLIVLINAAVVFYWLLSLFGGVSAAELGAFVPSLRRGH